MDNHQFAQMAGIVPIPPEVREAARKRIDPANAPFVIIRWPDGSETKMLTGTVDFNDYTLANGYAVVPDGYDKWGYRTDLA